MDLFTTFRGLADTWGLLFLVTAFLIVVAFAFRPNARDIHHHMASLPLREDDRPRADKDASDSQKRSS